jgi:hypothetical protein
MTPSTAAHVRALRVLPIALALVGACGGGPPPASPTPGAAAAHDKASAGAAGARKVAALGFEARGKGRPFPFALVEGSVAGRPTRFILDTGAGVHTIDESLRAAAGLPLPANASTITIEGWGKLAESPAAVVALSATLRAHGIGGILAPQLLAEGGQAVVVDFVGKQLRLRPRSAAWSEIADFGARLGAAAEQRPCAVDVNGTPGALLTIDGAVDGEPARFLLDTGAGRSTLDEGSKGGARAATHPVLGRSIGAFTSGDVATTLHGGVAVAVGAWSTTLDVGLVAAERSSCGHEGRLGIDVLQQCALALAEGAFVAACRTPSATGR